MGALLHMLVALFAAFPQELKHIRKTFPSSQNLEDKPVPHQVKQYPACDIITVQTGMGSANVQTAFRRILREHHPDVVISAGFGGALYEEAKIGDIVWSTRSLFIGGDGRTGQLEHHHEGAVHGSTIGRQLGEKLSEKTAAAEGIIVTLSGMMSKSKIKKMIPHDLLFPVCDMETFYLAKLSHLNRVPFLALRSITDRLNEDVPLDLLAVTDSTGQYSFSRALMLLLAKPKLIPVGIKFGKNAARASKNLGMAVDSLVEILSSFKLRD
jgi:adenosylhomocysteine nucleosidase